MMWCAAGKVQRRGSVFSYSLSPDPFNCWLLSGPCKALHPQLTAKPVEALRRARDRTDHGTNSTDAIWGRGGSPTQPDCPNLSRRSEWVNQIYINLKA